MFKLAYKFLKTTPWLLTVLLTINSITSQKAQANEVTTDVDSMLGEINYYNESSSMDQVTSVSQLRDVSPTDWAYEALRSLVERYGCIVGYPDRTYRGNRALSRYEFAAGLNACMQQMERLIASSEAVLREDIELLKRLMKEFETELATLGARVDNLEGRVAFLEDHQFSTTTKLKGEVIIAFEAAGGPQYKLDDYYNLKSRSPLPNDVIANLADSKNLFSGAIIPGVGVNYNTPAVREAINDFNNGVIDEDTFQDILSEEILNSAETIEESDEQATLSNRVRLTLNTSFTGEDLLRIRLAAGNIPNLGSAFGANTARLNFQQSTDNDVELDRVYYRTPIGDNFTFWFGVDLPPEDIYETFSPFTESSGTGALARANRYNPFIYRTTGGGGIGAKYKFNDTFDITATYLAGDPSSPERGKGLFNGQYSTGAQIGIHPTDNLSFGIAYMFNYYPEGEANLTGSLGSNYSSGVANALALISGDGRGGFQGSQNPFSDAATTSNNVGIQGSWRVSDGINLAAWGGWLTATGRSHDSTGVNRDGDWTEMWTWNANISFIDLLKDGAVLTLAGGQLPRAGYVDGTFGRDYDPAWILEGQYKYPINDNISITPGVYAVFKPNGNDSLRSDTIVVGVIRTVFKF